MEGGTADVRARSGVSTILLAVGLFFLYTANRRHVGAGDTVPAMYLAVALARGDGPWLDRFDSHLRTADGRLPGYAEDSRGHAVSRYPLGPALVAWPFVALQVGLLDRLEPGWEHETERARLLCRRMAKNAAAAIVALTAVMNVLSLRRLGAGRFAVPASLIVALGSDDWSTASQALWQHGPAEFCLSGAILLLLGPATRPRLIVAGLATALLVVCRPIDLVFAVGIAVWVLRHHARRDRWAFCSLPMIIALLLVAYHVTYFGTLTGGYAAIERMHPWAHGTRGTWTTPFFQGATGTLLSPSHGLLVFCPWVPLALALLPWSVRDATLGRERLVLWLLGALAINLVLLSKYSCWWAGHCFGPRFWIDANPILAIAVGLGLNWSWRRCRPMLVAFGLAFLVSAGIQAVAFTCYPSHWHGVPTNADRDHARLWDWRDSEVTRCLSEGMKAPMW